MPAPSKTQYARKADAEDHIVCRYKGLRASVLHRLQASGFDTNIYCALSEAYRQTAFDKKSSATTRHESKQQYIAEKRKVLRALAASRARNVTANSQKLRHGRIFASKSSSGSTRQRRSGGTSSECRSLSSISEEFVMINTNNLSNHWCM